jgi:hypothetical protein
MELTHLRFSGYVIEGVCESCGRNTKVGIVFVGVKEETLAFYCRKCCQELNVAPVYEESKGGGQ